MLTAAVAMPWGCTRNIEDIKAASRRMRQIAVECRMTMQILKRGLGVSDYCTFEVKVADGRQHNPFSPRDNDPFRLLSRTVKYLIFILTVISPPAWRRIHSLYIFTSQELKPRQTRSLPVSTGLSQQRIIIHNNINSSSADTLNSPRSLIQCYVCLPCCLHLEVDIWLSVCQRNPDALLSVCLSLFSVSVSMLKSKMFKRITAGVCFVYVIGRYK